jgi:hypothetical protein
MVRGTSVRKTSGPAGLGFVWRVVLGVTAGLVLAAIASTPAHAAFGIAGFDGAVLDQSGNAFTKAGGHPYSASVSFRLNTAESSLPDGGAPKNVRVDLPPGLVGNPQAMPKCSKKLLIPSGIQAVVDSDVNNFCPMSSIVGFASIELNASTESTPVFSIDPPPGVPAEFGISFLSQTVYFDAMLRSDGDYGLSVRARNLNQAAAVIGSTVTLWGVPADHGHDNQRCLAFISPSPTCFDPGTTGIPALESNPANTPAKAFLTNPTSCTALGTGLETKTQIDSWEPTSAPAFASFISHNPPGFPLPPDQWGSAAGPSECENLPFAPTLSVKPTSTIPDAPTGLDVDLSFPQDNIVNPLGLATAHLRRATVTLPAGMTVSPSSADGLKACTDMQVGFSSLAAAQCPDAAKIGTADAVTPLLAEHLTGSVFVGTQNSDDPESGDLFRIILVLENADRGIRVKLLGHVRANEKTGRLEATFDDNPQLPVSQIHLSLKGGDRAPLANPPACGKQTVISNMSSWGGQIATPSDSFMIDCPGSTGFSPGFRAGSANAIGGAFTPFSVGIDRPDRQQYLAGVTVETPVGLIAKLKGVPLCGDAQANAGTCPIESRVGTATVGAGPGSHPFFVKGSVSLTGPYKDAPYGLAVAVRAVAGPFDLGTVVVRQAIYVDPTDAHLNIVSDPLPTIVKGVPLRLRSVNVDVDRPGFTINPTSCADKVVKATFTSIEGVVSTSTERFQAAECKSLAFTPKLAFTLTGKGQTTGGKHPGLKSVLTQGRGQSNMRKVEVKLPLSLALDPKNAVSDTLCSFEEGQKANPRCPKSSIVGTAVATTPVLNRPLRGSVFFVKNVRINSAGRPVRTLPTLLIALRGEVSLNVRAKTSVSGGHLVTTFPVVPDAPVSRFALTLKGGRKGILTVSQGNLCRRKQVSSKLLLAHNGKRIDGGVTMKTPCGSKKKSKK